MQVVMHTYIGGLFPPPLDTYVVVLPFYFTFV